MMSSWSIWADGVRREIDQGQFSFVTSDQDEPMLQLQVLEEVLQEVASHHKLLIVNACRSGELNAVQSIELGKYFSDFRGDNGIKILSSTSIDRNAFEDSSIGGSNFFIALKSALSKGDGEGICEADYNGDKTLSLRELYEYIREKTMESSQSTQVPVLGKTDQEFDMLVIRR